MDVLVAGSQFGKLLVLVPPFLGQHHSKAFLGGKNLYFHYGYDRM